MKKIPHPTLVIALGAALLTMFAMYAAMVYASRGDWNLSGANLLFTLGSGLPAGLLVALSVFGLHFFRKIGPASLVLIVAGEITGISLIFYIVIAVNASC